MERTQNALDTLKKLQKDLETARTLMSREEGALESDKAALESEFGLKSLKDIEEELNTLMKRREEIDEVLDIIFMELEEKYGWKA